MLVMIRTVSLAWALVAGLGTVSLPAGCSSVAELGWQWETETELAGRLLSYLC